MSNDVKTLVHSLSSVANQFLQNGDRPPISGATIDAWGHLDMVQPPPGDRYSRKRQIEQLEASYRRAATQGLCRACGHMLDVNVYDPSGTDRQAILVAVETSAGLALDVFIPFEHDRPPVGGTIDPGATFANPRTPRVFQFDQPVAELDATGARNRSATTPSPPPSPPSSSGATQLEEPNQKQSSGDPTPDTTAEIQTRLLAAIVRGDYQVMDQALREGARLDEPLLGQTPVEMALRAEAAGALDWLLDHGAPLPALDLGSWRELNQPKRMPLLRILLEHGLKVPFWYPAANGLFRMGTTLTPARGATSRSR